MTEITALQSASRLREQADRTIQGRLELLPSEGRSASCQAGCAACCRQLVVVSPLEALALVEFLEAHPALLAAARERVEQWREAFPTTGRLPQLLAEFEATGGSLPDALGAELEEAYWREQIACPFLDDERCSVYAVRPFACREHCVTSAPELCALDLDAPTHAGTRLEMRVVANEVGSRCFGLADRLILLPMALLYREQHREEGGAAADAARVEEVTAEAQRRARMVLARVLLGVRRGEKR